MVLNQEADDIFSPTILIESLSCVAHLTLQINILVGTKSESSHEEDKRHVFMVTVITTVYLCIRFISSSLFAEMIHRERFKCQRSLYEQSGDEFWSYDLELLVVSWFFKNYYRIFLSCYIIVCIKCVLHWKTKRFVHQLTLPLGFTGCGFFKLGKSYLIAVSYVKTTSHNFYIITFHSSFEDVRYYFNLRDRPNGYGQFWTTGNLRQRLQQQFDSYVILEKPECLEYYFHVFLLAVFFSCRV